MIKFNFPSPIKSILTLFFILIVSLFVIIKNNQYEVRPTSYELILLKKEFGNIEIQDSSDIIRIQNAVIKKIKHKFNGSDRLVLLNILKAKSGFCYDRSLILQKILIHNNIKIRPVYIFYRIDGKEAKLYDIFGNNISSHNVFEFNWNNKWYFMKTNYKMSELINLDSYMQSGSVPQNAKYIRHLNNRNGRFIAPSWLPDIY